MKRLDFAKTISAGLLFPFSIGRLIANPTFLYSAEEMADIIFNNAISNIEYVKFLSCMADIRTGNQKIVKDKGLMVDWKNVQIEIDKNISEDIESYTHSTIELHTFIECFQNGDYSLQDFSNSIVMAINRNKDNRVFYPYYFGWIESGMFKFNFCYYIRKDIGESN